MPAAETLEAHRLELQRLAYRMLGSRTDAEDVVQDTFVRWQQAGVTPDNLGAWLTRTCVRLSLDRLKSAQRTRVTYMGPWLPEPWIEAEQDVPAELDETLSVAVLFLLERLKPAERAALVLHDVFDYKFHEVAEILGRSPTNCRQLAVRARRHLRSKRPRLPVAQAEYETVTKKFHAALLSGDVSGLRDVLTQDVVVLTDGGGKVVAARKPVRGIAKVALFLTRAFPLRERGIAVQVWFNGAPGLVLYDHGKVFAALQLEVEQGKAGGIFVLRNPDKLTKFAARALGPGSVRQGLSSTV